MKKIIMYLCDLCGAEYDCETDARLCEVSHVIPVELDKCYHLRYSSYNNSPFSKYPIRIRVKMSDGETVTYSFERGPATRTENKETNNSENSQ